MRTLPHLTHLQAFEAAARHLSFSRAAEELNCTQSAISQRVRALEHFVGRPLFHRKPNGLELSDVGQAYRPGVTEALDMLDAATQGLVGRRAQRSVTVSAPVSFATLWLASHMGEFHAAHPGVEVRVNSTIWTDPNMELADINITVVDRNRLAPEMTALSREGILLVARAGEPLPEPGESLAPWINGQRLVYIQGRHQLWDSWAKATGTRLSPTPPPIKVDNAMTALEVVARSGGLTVALETHCRPALNEGHLVTPEGGSASTSLVHAASFNAHRTVSATAQDFHDWLVQCFARR